MATGSSVRQISQAIRLEDLVEQSQRASTKLEQVRGLMLSPTADKRPPVFTTGMLASLCGIEVDHVAYRLKKGDLPQGTAARSAGIRFRRRLISAQRM